jgi:hypothetical protein
MQVVQRALILLLLVVLNNASLASSFRQTLRPFLATHQGWPTEALI